MFLCQICSRLLRCRQQIRQKLYHWAVNGTDISGWLLRCSQDNLMPYQQFHQSSSKTITSLRAVIFYWRNYQNIARFPSHCIRRAYFMTKFRISQAIHFLQSLWTSVQYKLLIRRFREFSVNAIIISKKFAWKRVLFLRFEFDGIEPMWMVCLLHGMGISVFCYDKTVIFHLLFVFVN